MYNIEAQLRNKKIKAKNLRKEGFTPCCLYGSSLDDTVLLQIPENEAMKMLREKNVGGLVKISVNGNTYNALIKSFDTNVLNNQIIHIDFQNVHKDDVVNGVAQVSYINNNDTLFLVHRLIDEIPYTAKAENIIENVVVNLSDIQKPKEFLVRDLDIAKDENITLNIDPELVVINVVPNSGIQIEEDADSEEDPYAEINLR